MSRLDRLVRAARVHLHEDEALLGSVLGRVADGRARAALLATDRQIVVVVDRLGAAEATAFRYADVTELRREDRDGRSRIDIVSSTGRASVDRIPDDATSRVVLRLLQHRAAIAEDRTVRTATAGTPGLRHGVRVRT